MNSNYCVCCGEEIPEGRTVCPYCENGENSPDSRKNKTVTEAPIYEPSRYRRNQRYRRKK